MTRKGHTMIHRTFRHIPWLLVFACAALSLAARAAAWPDKPVKLIVTGGPGGVTDVRARWLAGRLQQEIGQPVVVENRPGAGGIVGTEAAIHSAPDGHTILVVHQGTMVVDPLLRKDLPYDPLAQLTMLTRLGHGALVLVVNPKLPVKTIADLVRYSRTRPGGLSFGSPGVGTPPHLAAELFLRETGMKAVHVPYKGGGQAASDLIGGQVDFSVEGTSIMVPYIRSGRVRALAVTTATRSTALPDVPTMREAGVRGYEYVGWVGLAVPSATPRPIVDKIYAAVAKVLHSEEARAWFAEAGVEPGGESPEVFDAFVRAEQVKWGLVLRDLHLEAE